MTTFEAKLNQIVWPKALLGMVLTCVIALSVHVVMLEVLDVPYPSGYPTTGWPAFSNLALTALSLTYIYSFSSDEFARFSLPVRCLLLFILAAMMGEALIRRPIMGSVFTSAWTYTFVANLPRVITALLLSILVVLAAPKVGRLWQKPVAAFLIAAILHFMLLPPINAGFGHILSSIANLNHDDVVQEPYGWQVYAPAYATYLEPVAACFVIVALIWDRLAKSLFTRTAQFALLVLMLNGLLIRPVVYIFYAKFSPVVALVSAGQFFLEVLTLALLTTFTWRWCQGTTHRKQILVRSHT